MSAAEDFTVLLNILAREGIDGNVISEFAKVKAMTHQYDSNILLRQQQQQQSQMMQNQGNLATSGIQPSNPIPEQSLMPPNPQNQGEMQPDNSGLSMQ